MPTPFFALCTEQEGIAPQLIVNRGGPIQVFAIPFSAGGGALPLARFWWIDGNTMVPPGMQDGSEGAPYQSPQAFLMAIGPPTSTDDANTVFAGVVVPTAPDVWNPNPQTWVIPPSRNVQIGSLVQSDGANANDFAPLTITWANTPLEGVTGSSLVLANLNINGLAMVVTDVAGAPASAMALVGSAENGTYQGTIDVSGASGFGGLTVSNAEATLVIVPPAVPTFEVLVESDTDWTSTGLSCGSFFSYDSAVTDAGGITAATTQSYFTSRISVPTLTAATQLTFDQSCLFQGPTQLAAPLATFDGPSWSTFLETGGQVGKTVVLVTGGFLAGQVPGAN